MSSKAYTYVAGLVAIFAGLATVFFGPSRLIDTVGGAAVLGGLAATAWATGGNRLLRNVVLALLITALFCGALFLAIRMTRV